MKSKFGKKEVSLIVTAVVLVAILIAGNIILQWQAPLLHGFFGGIGGSTDSEQAQAALGSGDEIVQEIAEDSFVLLKNDEVERDGENVPYLPLDVSTKFNLFGWGATRYGFLVVGGGSGGTPIEPYVEDGNNTKGNKMLVNLPDAFEKDEIEYNKDLTAAYESFSNFDADFRGTSGSTGGHAVDSLKNPGESFYTAERMNGAHDYSSTAVVVLSRWGAENDSGTELKGIGSGNGTFLELTSEEKVLFNKLREYKFDVVVLLNTCNPLELGFLDDYDDIIQACLYIGIPGQSGALAVPNVLVGSKIVAVKDENGNPTDKTEEVPVSPSGRLSDTFAYDWQTNSPNYNNVGMTSNIAYKEGIYFGYRWYETADAEGFFTANGTSYDKVVKYPFGYGLSYTTFTQEIVSQTWTENEELALQDYSVTVKVTNKGDFDAKDVVQLYYTAPYTSGGIEKASINLLAFAKTGVIPAGESEEVTLTFNAYDMASYDAYDANHNSFSGYELEHGAYVVKLMSNAHTPYPVETGKRAQVTFKVTNDIKIDKDPVTGTKVENLFTGDTAYADMPIDGSKGVKGGVQYLSRANHFSNYSVVESAVGALETAAENANKNYVYTGYDNNTEANGFMYDVDSDLILAVKEDGTRATQSEINPDKPSDNDAIVYSVNMDVVELLADWDSEFWPIFLDQLSRDDVRNLLGKGGFHTEGVASVGKPRTFDTDGPAGYNSSVVSPGKTTGWTVFPAETLSGCSWNTELMYRLGKVQGKIGVASGVNGWYAPGVNLHRSPYNSRNYEYYSEDGLLSGNLAANTIKGAKEENVYCYLKHFVLAESGQNSNNWYEWTTEQALRELYCKPFEIAVKKGGANAMMSAFNCVGAIWSGYNHALLTTMLREEWGFHGAVITDWGQPYMNEYGRAVKAGNDLWLNPSSTAASIDFNNAGEAYAARQSVKGILYTYIDTLYTSGLTEVTGASGAYSPLFIALWAILDVVIILGIGTCILFVFWSPSKKKKAHADGPKTTEHDE